MSNISGEEYFQIGSVARMSGLTVHAIRAWEKRYEAVVPSRSDRGRRLYDREAVRRLTLMKRLVDRGHAISTIANLDTEVLEERWEEELGSHRNLVENEHRPIDSFQLLVIGTHLHHLFRNRTAEVRDFKATTLEASLDEVHQETSLPKSDLVVIHCPTLFLEAYNQVTEVLKKSEAHRAIVIYNFSQRDLLREMVEASNIFPLCGPVSPREIRNNILAELARIPPRESDRNTNRNRAGTPSEDGIPERIFSSSDLARITMISGRINCECPQHLASLLTTLTSFESYSEECRVRYPEDARVHAFLAVSAGRARAIMEEALDHLIKAENLKY